MKSKLFPPRSSLLAVLAATVLASFWPRAASAFISTHNISAGNVIVIQNDTGNANTSVTTILTNAVNDFQLRTAGNSRGDFGIQVGSDPLANPTNGVVMAAITQNGRDNGEPTRSGIQYAQCSMAPGPNGYPGANNSLLTGYTLCSQVLTNDGGGSDPEWNINVAGAYLPFTNYLGGYAFNLAGANGSTTATNDTLIGSPQLAFGVNYINRGSGGNANIGKSIVALTNLGYNSTTDGILLVNGAKNESANYALSRPNITNGTWDVYLRDAGGAAGTGEEDPVAFVFIAKTNTSVISGRFLGDGSISIFSGNSPAFTVTSNGIGRYELKITGRSPTNGVLIVTPEGGHTNNYNNVISYEVNGAGDGYEIQTRISTNGVLRQIQSAIGVANFVYIPINTPGITVSPTNNLQTSESGATASFTVRLDTTPTDTVSIPVSSSNTGEGTVSTNLLVFDASNWNIPQAVTITGVDDGSVTDGNIPYTIILGAATSTDPIYNGFDPSDVSVVNLDNDTPGFVLSQTSGLITTEAGGTATFTMRLATIPSASVTIGLSSSDTSEGTVSPGSLSFDNTDWNVDKTVTITGVDDFVVDGNVAYTIVTAPATSTDGNYNNLNPADVSVTNLDNDTATLVVSAAGPLGLTVAEGQTTSYTVKLGSEPAANVTVNISSTDTAQGGTVSPSSLTFTPVNWSNTQPVTVFGANDLVIDGTTNWYLTNSPSSSDTMYAALAPIPVIMRTFDDEMVLTLPSQIGLNGYGTNPVFYGIGQVGVGLDGMASLNDPNTTNYNGGSLIVTISANATADDRLEIRNTGTGTGQIGVSGSTASYEGTTIASFSGGVGTSPLAVSFNTAATPAAVQALIRNLTFRNVTNNPSLNLRTTTMALAHVDGFTSTASVGVRVGLLRDTEFQEGADRGFGVYSGESDCHIAEGTPNSAFPTGNANNLMFMDWDGGSANIQVLMKYANIFGTNTWQVPSNAVIVSADLILRINDSGEGSPLYRMLEDWDPAGSTWSGFSGGISQDDIESRSTFDSQLQVGDAANTGIGTVSFSVLGDILAWQAGTDNFGWVMPGWATHTDGTGFVPGDSPIAPIADRPRLRITWVPTNSCSVASFRQGVGGYTGAVDTRIRQNAPDTSYATVTGVFIDWAVTGSTPENDEQVLLRFDNIIGNAITQIPRGSQVHAAVLDLAAVIGAAPGDGGNLYAMLTPWSDTDTWNTLVNGVTADGAEASATPSATLGNPTKAPQEVGGFKTLEMTSDVQAWVNGTRTNYGWVGLPWPTGADGFGFGTAEQATERNRPQLRVYYTPSIVIRSITRDSTTATIVFSGIIGNTYTVLRSGTVTGGYSSIGTATVQPDGSATFTDNSPLPGAAFYRISYP